MGLPYPLDQRLRDTARERAESLGDDRCVVCGETEGLEIHHRDENPLNNHPMNLIPLCHAHHRQAHRINTEAERLGRWKEGFLSAMGG